MNKQEIDYETRCENAKTILEESRLAYQSAELTNFRFRANGAAVFAITTASVSIFGTRIQAFNCATLSLFALAMAVVLFQVWVMSRFWSDYDSEFPTTDFYNARKSSIETDRLDAIEQRIVNWNGSTSRERSQNLKYAAELNRLICTAPIPIVLLSIAFVVSRYG
jgi:hypothetical protein